jgi:hypothetical protein
MKMHRENYSEQSAVVGFGAEALAADNTPAAIDLQGYDTALILLEVGVGGITFSGTNKVEFVVTHSDDDSTYTNVTDDDVIGVTGVTSGIVHSLTAAHAAATVTAIGYRGGKRYLKILADFSGTHGTATPMAATVVKSGAHFA